MKRGAEEVGNSSQAKESKTAESLAKDSYVVLNTGAHMPMVGYGTFLSEPGIVGPALEAALKAGYRHVDCAECYDNEVEIGVVFNKIFNDPNSGLKRENVFVTSKLWTNDFHPTKVRPALQKTLKDLQLSYLDLYLMHIPIPTEKKDGDSTAVRRAGFSLLDTWRVLEQCYKEGLVKAIGVSNFPCILINDFQNAAEVVPAVNQIERHPYLAQYDLLHFHQSLGITLTAYAPFGNPGLMADKLRSQGPLLSNPIILDIAKKHRKAPAQVLIRWQIDSGVVVIPKSITPARIAENFNVYDFKLDAEDMTRLRTLDCGFRLFAQDWAGVPCFS